MDIEDNLITKALLISDFNIINHPVHIITKDNQTSPSAFIPFCDIGGNLSAMGTKMENFDLPVCNSFVATNLHDQVCYEIDLKRFVDRNNIERVMKQGFNFIMDYNEDRQLAFDKHNNTKGKMIGLNSGMEEETNSDPVASIYLDTIGEHNVYNNLK